LNDRRWVIHTRTEERPPARVANNTTIANSMLSDGCVIETGVQINCSVLSPGVVVHAGAVVRNSILLTDVVIEAGAVVERAIIDKRSRIGQGARVGSADEKSGLTVIGKNSQVPPGTTIEAGVTIATDVIASDYPSLRVASGQTIETKRQPYEI